VIWVIALAALSSCEPIDIGTLPPPPAALEITALEDRSELTPGPRLFTIGQRVPLAIDVINRGGVTAQDVTVEPTLVRQNDRTPVGALAAVTTTGTAPRTIAGGERARFTFEVAISPSASATEWRVGARVRWSAGIPASAPESLERVWTLVSPPQLRVTRLEVRQGSTMLPHLSVNPGCPALVDAEIRNEGDAPALLGDVRLLLDGLGGLSAMPAPPPLPPPPRRIPPRGVVTWTFRVDATDRTPAGQRTRARVRAEGTDPSGQIATLAEPIESPTLDIVGSGSRLIVLEVSPTAGQSVRVAPGQRIELGARILYRQGPGSAATLERLITALHFARGEWALTPDAGNPGALTGCTGPLEGCSAVVGQFRFRAEVPRDLAPGSVTVLAHAVALDHPPEPAPAVVLCGDSEPGAIATSLGSFEIVR
jgi:hypothetical protein